MSDVPNDAVYKSNKYANVKSKIDSGYTMDKYYAKHSAT